MQIRPMNSAEIPRVARLMCQLWPEHDVVEMSSELADIANNEEAAVFLAICDNEPVGFAQCQLRHDYVEGTNSSPVGYLEGIYVTPEYRHEGIASQLLCCCEAWAKTKQCKEFASDCELENTESQTFHHRLGFQEANRIVCYVKPLD